MKFNLTVVLKVASLVVGGIGLVLSQVLDSHSQKEMKDELKNEILNELTKGN